MSEPNYLPLLILPLAGLVVIAVVWLILAFDRQHQRHTPTSAE